MSMRPRACRPPRLGNLLGRMPAPPAVTPQAEPSAGTRRWLALHLPDLATDRLARRDPALAGIAFTTWAAEGPARRLQAVNARGRGEGLLPGIAVADAQAIRPDLVLRPADPAADAALLTALAVWARRWTPLAAVDPPAGLLLDITGAAHLAGGEAALLREARARLAGAGFAVHAAIAGTAEAAGALARNGQEIVVAPGGEEAAIARLPLTCFRLEPELVTGLARFGLMRVADVLRQPRAALVRRLGPQALAALDAALGRHAVPADPVRPRAPALAEHSFPEPLLTAEALTIATGHLVAALCRDLHAAGLGARSLALDCHRVDGTRQRLGLGLGSASRDPAHLARMLRGRIERIAPGFGIERMVLSAATVEPLAPVQTGLDRDAGATLAPLLDRLAQRLGHDNVFAFAPRPSHVPHRAVRPADPHRPMPLPPPNWAQRSRPVRLLQQPRPVGVMAELPDGPPALLRFGQGKAQRVLRAEGPERIGGEWWAEDAPDEDYWRVETETGARLWLARRDGAWSLRGVFA